MASLLAWLAYDGARTSAGAAVASGKAWFYQPGTTSTQVTVFSDADGLYALTQPVSLDAGGRAVVYTDRVVQVEVQTAAGATVRLSDRANAIQARQVEIQNDGATGTDLTTGAQIAGGRTDLHTFVSRLLSSFGAPDGQVLVDGTAINLQDILAPLTKVYDVTASQYGADGDDTSDDTIAIQSAIDDAADAGGGIVLIPPGTYKITSPLVPTAGVWIVGVSASACTISQHTLNTNAVDSDTGICMANLTVKLASSASGGYLVYAQSAVTVENRLERCRLIGGPDASSTGVTVGVVLTGIASAISCEFVGCRVLNGIIPSGSQDDHLVLTACQFRWSENAEPRFRAFTGANITAVGCSFRGLSASNTHVVIFDGASGGDGTYHLVGCRFFTTAGGAMNVFPEVAAATTVITEVGSSLGTNVTLWGAASVRSSTYRDSAYTRTSGSATTYAPNAAVAKYHEVISTGASFEWSTPTNPPTLSTTGKELVLRYKNTSGGAITPTFSAAYKMSAVSVANNSAQGWHLVYDATLACWVQIATTVAYAS